MDGAANLVHQLRQLAAETNFSGVAVVEDGEQRIVELAAGSANRSAGLMNTIATRFGIASGTKGFTALTAASLIQSDEMSFETSVTEVTDGALAAIDPEVTVEHLLGHTSGVGDYLDEEQLGDIDDYIFDVSPHTLRGPMDYVPILNRYPQVSSPGSRFVYNNGGYVMLALVIERAGGKPYHQLVEERVFEPAGMSSTGFLRSDDLPTGTAIGYLQDGKTNVFHLPIVGTGDGGAYTTADDMTRFWAALLSGAIVDPSMVERLTTVSRSSESGDEHSGLGFWIGADRRTLRLEGMDAGVSFRSCHRPDDGRAYTVVSNSSSGVWPLAKFLDEALFA